MAELTKDDIKSALGFIAEGKVLLSLFEKAESAIVVLGQLNASVSSLTAKESRLKGDIATLEAAKGKLGDELHKAKADIAAFRDKGIAEAGDEVGVYAASIRAKAKAERDAVLAEKSGLEEGKAKLVNLIVDLSKDRDGIAADIKALKADADAESKRLAAIKSDIEAIKGRL